MKALKVKKTKNLKHKFHKIMILLRYLVVLKIRLRWQQLASFTHGVWILKGNLDLAILIIDLDQL